MKEKTNGKTYKKKVSKHLSELNKIIESKYIPLGIYYIKERK